MSVSYLSLYLIILQIISAYNCLQTLIKQVSNYKYNDQWQCLTDAYILTSARYVHISQMIANYVWHQPKILWWVSEKAPANKHPKKPKTKKRKKNHAWYLISGVKLNVTLFVWKHNRRKKNIN